MTTKPTNGDDGGAAKPKTAYEKALDERFGAGFSALLKKDKTCPNCKSDEEVFTDSCPTCQNNVNFCRNCERFF